VLKFLTLKTIAPLRINGNYKKNYLEAVRDFSNKIWKIFIKRKMTEYIPKKEDYLKNIHGH